ncbi:MAG: hypothetical protein ACREEV_04225, partial [Dongiaceae bacterium]
MSDHADPPQAQQVPPAAPPPRRSHIPWLFGIGLLAAAAAGGFYWYQNKVPQSAEPAAGAST